MPVTTITGRILYNGYKVASTNFVYNASGETGAEAGWRRCRSDEVAVTYNVATLNATNLTYVVEGRFPTYNRAFEIYKDTLTATNTSRDAVIVVGERCNELRLGVKVNNSATPNVFYSGLCLTDYKR